MTTTVADIKERLASIQADILGVKRAYARAPKSLPGSDLPAFVTFVGPATNVADDEGSGMDQENRDYIMRLYVMPLGSGVNSEAMEAVEPFLTLVGDTFRARPGLGNGTAAEPPLPEVIRAVYLGDSGVTLLSYAGQEYLGSDFRIRVERVVEVDYAPYE